jgi:hypothetical protein
VDIAASWPALLGWSASGGDVDSTLVEWFASANSGELDESMNENDLQNEFLRLALLLAKKQLFSSGGGWL